MKILYYIYQICIALPILLVLTILTALVTIVGSLLGGAHIWGYYPGKIWSQLICLFLLIPVKIQGREKLHDKTSYIFVPNHQGSFDIFLIYGFIGRNFKWMMKKSLRKLPFVGKACESAGHIFVDRSGPKKVLETIRQAKDSLKDGVSLVVFPEGARTFTGHMGYFKKGAFQLADDLQLAVVPVTIDGSFEILPRTGKWIHRHRMILTIHEPIPPKGKGMENIKATMAEAYAAVESALPEKHKGMIEKLYSLLYRSIFFQTLVLFYQFHILFRLRKKLSYQLIAFKRIRSVFYDVIYLRSHNRIRQRTAKHDKHIGSQHIFVVGGNESFHILIHLFHQRISFHCQL